MKFLCICQYGHSRSVAMARMLHGMGHEAVAVGYGTAVSAFRPLGEWADNILVVDMQYGLPFMAMGLSHKTTPFPLGPDIWSNPYHSDLQKKCVELFELMKPHFCVKVSD